MSQYPWKPLRLSNLEQQIDQAFDKLIHGIWKSSPPSGAWQPEIDVYETDDSYLVEADVPGVPPQDIRVEVDEHGLTISGWRHSSRIARSAQGVRIERQKGGFSRAFFLEHAVDPQRVERTHEEGTLVLRISKRTPHAQQ
jgi:HSP20 family protein